MTQGLPARQSMNESFQRIVLASRPRGLIIPDNFRLESCPQPQPDTLQAGEVLVKNRFLSLDPYMRGRMSTAKSYATPQALDAVMLGETAGSVIASRYPGLQPGDSVTGQLGWTEIGVCQGDRLRKVDAQRIPLSAYLGVAGMPGVTAWYGVNQILNARAGQTLVVSAASGAVGSVVGQLAKQRGCRVVGIAGGERKVNYVVEQLGFDACIDYQRADDDKALIAALAEATPDGIDLVFENVGGRILDASLANLNAHASIALCGMIAGYSGQPQALQYVGKLLTMRVRLQGFIITEHPEVWPEALEQLSDLVAAGGLVYSETIADGLAAAPQALIGLLQGKNLGKQLVRLCNLI